MNTLDLKYLKPENLWIKDGVWHFSKFIRDFRTKVLKYYPDEQWTTKAKEPQDVNTIAQNLIYLFPGHVLKIPKALYTVFEDEEAMTFLSETDKIVILDLACGAGTASIGVVDFILQQLKEGTISRKSPLKLSFIFNDIEPNCVKSTKKHFGIINDLLSEHKDFLRIGTIETCAASISEVISFLKNKSKLKRFNLMVMAHPFDPILYHAERALEVDPDCKDPLIHARPCDRPKILGDFYIELGRCADPYFSRALLVQENRYCPLLPICLPSKDLKVIRALMIQEAMRPDCPTDTMKVPFGYCGFEYGYPAKRVSRYPVPQPLSHMEDMQNCFEESVSEDYEDI
jgi:hypothetical protein